MQFQDKFVVLTANRMVDPVLGIKVQAGHFELDDSTQVFRIMYDPCLRLPTSGQGKLENEAGRLSEEVGSIGSSGPPEVESMIEILGFGIQHVSVGDSIVLKLDADENTYVSMKNSIKRKLPGSLSEQPDDLIYYIIHSMPNWYGSKQATPCEWKGHGLTFLIKESFAKYTPRNEFGGAGDGYVVFDEREIT